MIHRIVAGVLFVASLALIGVGYVIYHPWLVGWCQQVVECLDQSTVFGIGEPLLVSLKLLPLLFFVLIFVRKEVFSMWWKIALPLGVVFAFLGAGQPYDPKGLNVYLPDRTIFTGQLVWLFVVISAVIIAWAYARLWWKGRRAA